MNAIQEQPSSEQPIEEQPPINPEEVEQVSPDEAEQVTQPEEEQFGALDTDWVKVLFEQRGIAGYEDAELRSFVDLANAAAKKYAEEGDPKDPANIVLDLLDVEDEAQLSQLIVQLKELSA